MYMVWFKIRKYIQPVFFPWCYILPNLECWYWAADARRLVYNVSLNGCQSDTSFEIFLGWQSTSLSYLLACHTTKIDIYIYILVHVYLRIYTCISTIKSVIVAFWSAVSWAIRRSSVSLPSSLCMVAWIRE